MPKISEQISYYTHPSVEQFSSGTSAIGLAEKRPNPTKPVRRLTNSLLEAFSNPQSVADTKIFHNGEPLASPRSADHKLQFEATIADIVREKCNDLLTPEGTVKQESNTEWANILDVAPAVAGILLSHENHISAVNREASANIASVAIDIARDPDLLGKTVIGTGFGGSDDEFTSTRLTAYMLPGLKIVRNLQNYYQTREQNAVNDTVRNKVFGHLTTQAEEQKRNPLERDERKKVDRLVRVLTNGEKPREEEKKSIEGLKASLDPALFELDQEEMDTLREDNAIATQMPTVRFFFGSQAAIAINHTMQPDGIRRRLSNNKKILGDYVTTQFPGVAEHVEFVEDKPWTEHTTYQTTVIEYCADVLRQSDEPSIVKTLQLMEQLGENHGGEEGSERAAEYAAIHPLIFGDRVNLPYSSFLEGNSGVPEVNITIGGPTEKSFTALRRYLTEHANPTDFQDFVERKSMAAQEAGNQERATELAVIGEQVARWESITAISRSAYEAPGAQPLRVDKPLTVELSTTIGGMPTYYAKAGIDRVHGSITLAEQITELEQPVEGIETPEPEKLRARLVRSAVLYDLRALREELNHAEKN